MTIDKLLIEVSTTETSEQENSETSTDSISDIECCMCQNDLISLHDLQEKNYHNIELHTGRTAIFCQQCIEIIIVYLANL